MVSYSALILCLSYEPSIAVGLISYGRSAFYAAKEGLVLDVLERLRYRLQERDGGATGPVAWS